MSSTFLEILAYLGALVGLAAILLLLDSLLLGLANRFANRSAEHRHRVGSQYPRVPQNTPKLCPTGGRHVRARTRSRLRSRRPTVRRRATAR